jgi:sodium--glutamate symport carrier gltS
MTQLKKWIWPAVGLAVAAAGYTIQARDADIQTEREASAQLISTFGPAPRAFLILPLVSAFFIDLMNAVLIPFFLRRA